MACGNIHWILWCLHVVTQLKSLMRNEVALIKIILWVDLPCTTMTKYTLKRHETSECHNAARMLEASLCMSRQDGGIREAFAALMVTES